MGNALIDANSVAGMMITTESVVVDVPIPYEGPPEVEEGETPDPSKHKVPEDWSYERALENEWMKTERMKAEGRFEEADEKDAENPWDLLDQLPGGFTVGLPQSRNAKAGAAG